MAAERTKQPAKARPLRADARRNRERVLSAARQVFAERGEEATLAEVASRAGVGVGTVYRHYTNKAALLDDLFDERLAHFESAIEDALANPDPWDAFVSFIERAEEGYARNRALGDLRKGPERSNDRRALARQRIFTSLNVLIERAKDAGELPADFTTHDIDAIHTMLSSVIRDTEDATPGLWRRYLEILIDGLQHRAAAATAR